MALFGKHYNQNLVTVETDTTIVSIRALPASRRTHGGHPENSSSSSTTGSSRHPYLHRAVMEAYQGILPPETVPAYFLFMTADPSTIDVNIHPTKTEIKFEDERSVWQIMLASVREALGRFNVVPSIDFGPEGAVEIPVITGDMPAPQTPRIEVDTLLQSFRRHEYNRPETKWKGDDET